jgi:hypothetical protein
VPVRNEGRRMVSGEQAVVRGSPLLFNSVMSPHLWSIEVRAATTSCETRTPPRTSGLHMSQTFNPPLSSVAGPVPDDLVFLRAMLERSKGRSPP